MHWVNPPHLIPLVEVMAGEHSSQEVLQIVCDVADSLHQKPVWVYKDPTGFILNRLQYACLREACHCVEMGYASLEDVATLPMLLSGQYFKFQHAKGSGYAGHHLIKPFLHIAGLG